jgi:hypothetical protein
MSSGLEDAVGAGAEDAAAAAEAAKRRAIIAIMRDATLSDAEKARKRQELMMGSWAAKAAASSAGTGTSDEGNGHGDDNEAGAAGPPKGEAQVYAPG